VTPAHTASASASTGLTNDTTEIPACTAANPDRKDVTAALSASSMALNMPGKAGLVVVTGLLLR